MKEFTNENAKKAMRVYGMIFMAAFVSLLAIGVTIYIGMRDINEVIKMYPELASKRVDLFIHYQRTETIIVTILIIVAVYFFGLGLVRTCQFAMYVHTHGKDHLKLLDQEMNQSHAIWLPKSKTYLTANYIISFRGAFTAVRYIDIIWIYQGEERMNGVQVKRSVTVLLSDATRHKVASSEPVKSLEDEFTIIFGTVAEQNPDVLIGYSNENIAISKDIIKQRKYQR